MRLRQLELLAALARAPTLSAAARAVNLSQPAASKLLNRLAADLGVALFERAGRTLRPTAAGQALLRRAGHGNGNGNGHSASAPATSAAALFHDDEAGQRISLRGQALPLTRREYRLLSHLLRGAGRIHARDALLAAAWGDDSESTDRTVDTHIKTLRAKLREVDAGRDYISTHRGMGYCLDV